MLDLATIILRVVQVHVDLICAAEVSLCGRSIYMYIVCII